MTTDALASPPSSWSATRPNLFQQGCFVLHSGEQSKWKIDCDALSDDDIRTAALMLSELLPSFGQVYGIPRGGQRVGEALRYYIAPGSDRILLVDDVYTTGASLYRARDGLNLAKTLGAVLFARRPTPYWVTALFTRGVKRIAL